ncbi:carabin-like [Ictalurus furcatus]|uniref:carabin-like n=1 Tax=Ictalurus furcatus TaxID=66913 RepID=UPI0023502048|nr:carabin-like [Ictalurus furcatus]
MEVEGTMKRWLQLASERECGRKSRLLIKEAGEIIFTLLFGSLSHTRPALKSIGALRVQLSNLSAPLASGSQNYWRPTRPALKTIGALRGRLSKLLAPFASALKCIGALRGRLSKVLAPFMGTHLSFFSFCVESFLLKCIFSLSFFLCVGVKMIFRVGLVLLTSMLGTRDKACPGQYETMEVLRAIEPRYMREGFLVLQVLELQVSAQDMEREQRTQLKRWKKKRGEPGPKLPQRMHSARAIMATKPHTHQDLCQKPTIMV